MEKEELTKLAVLLKESWDFLEKINVKGFENVMPLTHAMTRLNVGYDMIVKHLEEKKEEPPKQGGEG